GLHVTISNGSLKFTPPDAIVSGETNVPDTTKDKRKIPSPKTDEKQFAKEIAAALVDWQPTEKSAALARWSLETLTHLTEYEDEKANRIFTAVAFLSALVGALFAVSVTTFPFKERLLLWSNGDYVGWGLLLSMY